MPKTILRIGLFCILVLAISDYTDLNLLLGNNAEAEIEQLLIDLKDYIYSYYSAIRVGLNKSKEGLLREIKAMVVTQFNLKDELKHIDDIDELGLWLDRRLKPHNKSINIFSVDNSEIVNCWLGDLVEEKTELKNIWGKEVKYTIKVLDKLIIQDFSYFSSRGKEALDAGTRQETIYYNLEAYRIRANSIWDFFAQREKENKSRRYDPRLSNRLRKKLYIKNWLTLYLNCVKTNPDNKEEARGIFIDRAVALLKENSLFHELGHIFTNKYQGLENSKDEEIAAFLSELRYGSLPFESLDTIISAAYQSQLSDYNLVGREIVSYFLSYIKDEQKRSNPGYKNIHISGINQLRNTAELYELTEPQLRCISEYIFKQKYNYNERG